LFRTFAAVKTGTGTGEGVILRMDFNRWFTGGAADGLQK